MSRLLLYLFLFLCAFFAVSSCADDGTVAVSKARDKPAGKTIIGQIMSTPKKQLKKVKDFARGVAAPYVTRHKTAPTRGKKNRHQTVHISDEGETVYIGESKRVQPIGCGNKAICTEVLNEDLNQEVRNVKTQISPSEFSIDNDFELLKSKLWKCMDLDTSDTFFRTKKEYTGLVELAEVYIYPDIIAWPVHLDPDDANAHEMTARFTEKRFLTENAEPLNYVGRVSYHKPKKINNKEKEIANENDEPKRKRREKQRE